MNIYKVVEDVDDHPGFVLRVLFGSLLTLCGIFGLATIPNPLLAMTLIFISLCLSVVSGILFMLIYKIYTVTHEEDLLTDKKVAAFILGFVYSTFYFVIEKPLGIIIAKLFKTIWTSLVAIWSSLDKFTDDVAGIKEDSHLQF